MFAGRNGSWVFLFLAILVLVIGSTSYSQKASTGSTSHSQTVSINKTVQPLVIPEKISLSLDTRNNAKSGPEGLEDLRSVSLAQVGDQIVAYGYVVPNDMAEVRVFCASLDIVNLVRSVTDSEILEELKKYHELKGFIKSPTLTLETINNQIILSASTPIPKKYIKIIEGTAKKYFPVVNLIQEPKITDATRKIIDKTRIKAFKEELKHYNLHDTVSVTPHKSHYILRSTGTLSSVSHTIVYKSASEIFPEVVDLLTRETIADPIRQRIAELDRVASRDIIMAIELSRTREVMEPPDELSQSEGKMNSRSLNYLTIVPRKILPTTMFRGFV